MHVVNGDKFQWGSAGDIAHWCSDVGDRLLFLDTGASPGHMDFDVSFHKGPIEPISHQGKYSLSSYVAHVIMEVL